MSQNYSIPSEFLPIQKNESSCSCCNCSDMASNEPGVLHPDLEFIIGLVLSICSSVFIGASFVLKKKSLIRLASRGEELRAGNGGLGYLKDGLWWSGLLAMAIGEAANFAAYVFVPAALVTPLGGLSVIMTSILASYFLNERLNLIGKMACGLCFLGSTVTILHAPKDAPVGSVGDLGNLLAEPAFVAYLFVVVILVLILMIYFSPRYGNSIVFVNLFICSLIGSLGVMCVKAFGLAIINTANGFNEFKNGLTYIFIITLILCLAIQMNYLNRALDVFNTSVVNPIYYVFFTTFVMIATGILYDEFTNLSWADDLGLLVGFLVNVTAVFMIHLFKDYDIGFHDVKHVFKPQTKAVPIVPRSRSRTSLFKISSREDKPDFDDTLSTNSESSVQTELTDLISKDLGPVNVSVHAPDSSLSSSSLTVSSRSEVIKLADKAWRSYGSLDHTDDEGPRHGSSNSY